MGFRLATLYRLSHLNPVPPVNQFALLRPTLEAPVPLIQISKCGVKMNLIFQYKTNFCLEPQLGTLLRPADPLKGLTILIIYILKID